MKASMFLYKTGHRHLGVTLIAARRNLPGYPRRRDAGRRRDTRNGIR